MKYYLCTRLQLKKQLKSHKGMKLKEQYRGSHTKVTLTTYIGDGCIKEVMDDDWEIYPQMRSHTHRHFSTKQEASMYQMHELEYCREYGYFLRAKRSSSNLPNAWDDLPNHNWDLKRCWKHNSKRSKQYYK